MVEALPSRAILCPPSGELAVKHLPAHHRVHGCTANKQQSEAFNSGAYKSQKQEFEPFQEKAVLLLLCE